VVPQVFLLLNIYDSSQTTFMYQPSVKHNLSKFSSELGLLLLFNICYPEWNAINGPES